MTENRKQVSGDPRARAYTVASRSAGRDECVKSRHLNEQGEGLHALTTLSFGVHQ